VTAASVDSKGSKRVRVEERTRSSEPGSAGPVGYSSIKPLRVQRSDRIHHRKVKVSSFVGDRQASTAIGMAHLFGAHDVSEERGQSATSTATRTIFANNDEVVDAAGVDAEAPSESLLEHILQLAAAKVALSRIKGNSVAQDPAACSPLAGKFDRSALLAVGVLVEELVRDMMVHWYQTGAPLEFNGRALRTEALSQLNGAPNHNGVTPELLRGQLEVRLVVVIVVRS
jgi:hypothetical protein